MWQVKLLVCCIWAHLVGNNPRMCSMIAMVESSIPKDHPHHARPPAASAAASKGLASTSTTTASSASPTRGGYREPSVLKVVCPACVGSNRGRTFSLAGFRAHWKTHGGDVGEIPQEIRSGITAYKTSIRARTFFPLPFFYFCDWGSCFFLVLVIIWRGSNRSFWLLFHFAEVT